MLKHSKVVLICLTVSSCIGTDVVDDLIGPDLSKLTVDPHSISLPIDAQSQLMAIYLDYTGQPAETTILWHSRNENVASVDEQGTVTALSKGQTWVVAEAQQRADSSLVGVFEDPASIAEVSITAPKSMIALEEEMQLTANVRNGAGDPVNDYTGMWESANPAVASVSEDGLVKGLLNGFTSIRLTVEGVVSVPFFLMVGDGSRTGTFEGRSGYNASGTVRVVGSGDNYTVELQEDFSTQSGPGLHVYLGKNGNSGANGVDLGALQANSGAQSYSVPAAANPDDFSHILIYCKPFSVVFAAAELN